MPGLTVSEASILSCKISRKISILTVNVLDLVCKAEKDYQADFEYLKKQTGSSIFRTYAVTDKPFDWTPSCNVPAAILPAAKSAGVKVIIGLW